MSDLRNWEKNSGCANGEQGARRGAFERLARLLTTKKAGAIGACAALLLAAGSSFGAENGRRATANELESIPVASSPWTSPSGRAIVDLKAKSTAKTSVRVGKRAQSQIRQTQGVIPAPVADDSASLLDDGSLLGDAPSFVGDGSLLDDSSLPVDGGSLPVDDGSLLGDAPELGNEIAPPSEGLGDGSALLEDAPAPSQLGTLEEIPAPTPGPTRLLAPSDEPFETVPTPAKNDGAPRPLAPTTPSVPENPVAPSLIAEDLPSADVEAQTQNAPRQTGSQNAFYGGVSEAARPSNNPYARIGQAEYHPNQFYGMNAPIAGGSVPPVAAYGQNLWGEPTTNYACAGYWGGCCGFLQNLQLETGALATRSPLDFEDTGNFGAQFALNWASVRPLFCGLNVQAGARATQLDFNGTAANGFETDDARTQVFWTAGVFFRAPVGCDGWSAGVVYDSLIEDYYRQYELSQLRAELSYSFGGLLDVGFRGAFALNEDDFDFLRLDDELTIEAKATATSYYTMFLRTNFDQGAQATVFGGVTEWSEAIVGATMEAPLTDSFAIKGGATYIIPTERGLNDDRLEENWNVSAGVVWYLGGGARANACGGTRPLFDVADNGSFLQNFLR